MRFPSLPCKDKESDRCKHLNLQSGIPPHRLRANADGVDGAEVLQSFLLKDAAMEVGAANQRRVSIMLRQYISRLSKVRFWFSKWLVAGCVAGAVFVLGLVLSMTHHVAFDTL